MLCNFLLLGLSASFRLGEVEHLVKQLVVVVIDNGEVFGDIDICNFVVANVVDTQSSAYAKNSSSFFSCFLMIIFVMV